MKRFIAVFGFLIISFLVLPFGISVQGATFEDINQSDVFVKQQTNYTCTLASAVMMVRRAAMASGNTNWAGITESSMRGTAWSVSHDGMWYNFTFAGITVGHGDLNGTGHLIQLLSSHPEGIVVYNTSVPHAILVTDYTDGVFYCADPSNLIVSGRIPNSSASISVASCSEYWYVSSPSISIDPSVNYPNPIYERSYWGYQTDTTRRPVVQIRNPEAVSGVRFAVWSVWTAEQNDVTWYDGIFNGDKCWFYDFNVADFIGRDFNCHVYVRGKNGFEKSYNLTTDYPDPIYTRTYWGEETETTIRPVISFKNSNMVDSVKFAVWTTTNQSDIIWFDGMANGYGSYFKDVEIARFTNRVFTCHVYVYGTNGSVQSIAMSQRDLDETTPPVISEVDVIPDDEGYTVSCVVTDNDQVSQVRFPTWTDYNGQDDLLKDWITNDKALGSTSNGITSFRVNRSDHNNESGVYITDIYAFDRSGNASTERVYFDFDTFEHIPPVIENVQITLDDTGYTVRCKVTDNVQVATVRFPTWTAKDDKDDLDPYWDDLDDDENISESIGTYDPDTGEALFRVNFIDHYEERGLYKTEIYAYDISGNYAKESVNVFVDLDADVSVVNSIAYNGHKYEIYDNSANYTWVSARDYCNEKGGHLATVTSAEELAAVMTLFTGTGYQGAYIGGTDEETEGIWRWVTGEAWEYQNWMDEEPNNASEFEGGQDYLRLLPTGLFDDTWNDPSHTVSGLGRYVGCFICEYDTEDIVLTITEQPSDVEVNAGKTASFTVGADGTDLIYQWQYKPKGKTKWYTCSSTTEGYNTSELHVVGTTARNGFQYRCVIRDAQGEEVISDAAMLTVIEEAAVTITVQPQDQEVAEDATAVFEVAADGPVAAYQWQYKPKGKTKWYNCSTATEGYNTSELHVVGTAARNGFQYRCVLTFQNGETVISDAAVLSVRDGVTIISQPRNCTVDEDSTAVFTVEAEGKGLTYRWQYKPKGKTSWYNSSSATAGYNTAELRVIGTMVRNGYQYRCIVTDAKGNMATTEAALLTVTEMSLEITAEPLNQTVEKGATACFAVTAKGKGLAYRWQYKIAGSSKWRDCSSSMEGYHSAELWVEGTLARNGFQYHCVITDANGDEVISRAALLTVTEIALKITADPQSQTVAVGETAYFTVAATGEGLKYQWQYKIAGQSTWRACSSSTIGYRSAELEVLGTAKRNGFEYRCIVTDANGEEAASRAAVLTVE